MYISLLLSLVYSDEAHCVYFAFGSFWTIRTYPTTNCDKCMWLCTAHVFRCIYTPQYRNIKAISAAQLSRYKEDRTIGVTSLYRCDIPPHGTDACVYARTGSPHCTRHGGTSMFPFSHLLFFISLRLFLLFFFGIYYSLVQLCRITYVWFASLGSSLSGLGGSHVPWLRRGKITLTRWLTLA